MRIDTIAISNFRSHVSTTLSLSPLTVVRGANAAGKSSIEQAIDFALTGRAEGTDERGAGAKDMIRVGEKKATIALTLSQPTVAESVPRLLTCKLTNSGRDVAVTTPGDDTYAGGPAYISRLAESKAVLSCLINNRYFVSQSAADQKRLLADIILPTEYDWTKETYNQVKAAGLSADWTATPVEVIADVYSSAFEARKDAKRDRKNLVIPTGETDMADAVAEIEERLKERRSELQAANTRRIEMTGSYDATAKQRKTLATSIAACDKRIADEGLYVSKLDKDLLSPGKLKDQTKTAANLAKAKELDATIASTGTLAEAKKKLIDAFIKMKEGTCPTCLQAITGDSIGKAVEILTDEHGELNLKHHNALDERKLLGDPEGAQKAIDVHSEAKAGMTSAKGRIEDDETAKHTYQLEIDALPSAAPDTTEVDGQIADLTSRIAVGEAALKEANQHAALRDQQTKATARAKELDTKIAALETVVAYFGPGDEGILSKLLNQYRTDFEASINAVLEQWGYGCVLQMEPYHFLVYRIGEKGNGSGIELTLLSKSERYRFSVAFQVALAEWSGFRFVIVDEADIFDAAARGALFEALYGNEHLDQAIILTTDERTDVPEIEGGVFFRAETDNAPVPTTTVRRLLPKKE